MNRFIKTAGFLLLFWLVCLAGNAQQKHFMYVQSEDKQPFAIVLNGKVYSSSDYDYIIIPKLADGEYNFTVSFPMNKFPDQAFTCSIIKKDVGFFLKNSNDGWALENMQTQKLLVNSAAKAPQEIAFSDMLSEVVSDSNLTKTNIATAPATESANNTMNPVENAPVPGAAVAAAAAAAPVFITDSIFQLEKISEASLDTGTTMLFVDKSQAGNDTIDVFIPAETAAATAATSTKQPPDEYGEVNNTASENTTQNNQPVAETQNSNPVDATASNKDEAAEAVAEKSTDDVSNPFYNAEQNNKAAVVAASPVTASANDATNSTAGTTTPDTRYDCVRMLSDEEMDKLKRKMFSQDDDDKMVQYAVKAVGKKCITTDQVKTLGSLFSSDDGRYGLYDALYKLVYDYGNYASLESQILDPYYKKRFAAMLR